MVNKGSAGVDGLKTYQLADFFREHKFSLLEKITNNRYLPQPILGVEIPKRGGKFRFLGIPTVVDRLLQQAVAQAIMPRFEKDFSMNSFVRWCERRTPSVSGGAVYSIMRSFFLCSQFYLSISESFL